jgi:hypothetical protein
MAAGHAGAFVRVNAVFTDGILILTWAGAGAAAEVFWPEWVNQFGERDYFQILLK